MNNKIQLAQSFLANKTGRLGLIVQKHAPEIMLVGGLTGMVVATVLACKASMEVKKVIDDSKEEINDMKETREDLSRPQLVESLYKKQLTMAYVRAGFRFTKLYGPSLSLGGASILCIIGSHGLMRKRQVALIAAYNIVSHSFGEYRKRIVSELGPDKEYALRHNMKEELIEEVDAEGKVLSKKKKKVHVYLDSTASDYARFFDASNVNYREDNTLNMFFLRAQERYANELLTTRGHIFLNEVYNMLGLDHSPEGAMVGWVAGKGDTFVDFGIYKEGNESFVKGDEKVVLLDFNVSGIIFNQI